MIGLGDVRAWSGSDPGGKVATVRWMAQHHSWSPDVGYWAARADPTGAHHQLVYTHHFGGHWVQVTSLPLIYVGVPLYRLAGLGGLLVLPVLGSLLAAICARRLALLLGAPRGWLAFWLVGVGTPVLFYAGDFWEHSLAVGLVLAGLVLAFEPDGWSRCVLAGLAVGLAAVMRTEVLVYAFAFVIGALVVRSERREWFGRPVRAFVIAASSASVLVANALVERRVFSGGGSVFSGGNGGGVGAGGVRGGRAATIVSSAGSGAMARLRDGVLTAIGLFDNDSARAYLLGAVAVIGLVVLARRALRSPPETRPSPREAGGTLPGRAFPVLALATYGLRLTQWLGTLPGFVPGFFPAAPASAAGLATRSTARARMLVISALVAIPVVWLFEWRGQLLPQWGGRYLLLSGALLTIVGAFQLELRGWRSGGAAVLVVLALGVGLLSVVMHVERTRGVARALAQIERVPGDVVIVSGVPHLGREAGAWYGDHRWLSGTGRAGVIEAAAIARDEGAVVLEVVELDEGQRLSPAVLVGYRLVSGRHVSLLGFPLLVGQYRAT